MKKRRLAALVLAASTLLTLALAGCQPDQPSGSSPQPGAETGGSSGETSKDLVIGVVADVVSLDPAAKDSGTEMQIASHLYDPLVDYDADLTKKPGLAESWEILDDGVTWEFKLRQGVKFSNGNDFTADDVVYSIERILNDPTLEMGVYLMRLQEVKKVDDYTVQLVTKVPYPVFSGSLTHIMMLDKETCEGLSNEEIADNPVGTGRYRLVEHVKGSSIKLERNDEWWGDELPEAETVEFRVIANDATRTTALLNGEVDFISNIPVMDADRISSSEGVQIITSPSLSCNYLGFDLLNETGSDGTDDPNPLMIKEVRQAIYHAINIDEIIDVVMNGYATVANSYMPSICVGYNPDAERPAYDPDLAKELLAEAGYPDGFTTTFVCPTSGSGNMFPQIMNEYIKRCAEEVGINIELDMSESERVWDVMKVGFKDEYADVGALNTSFYTMFPNVFQKFAGTGGSFNTGNYSNPEYDACIENAYAATDPDESTQWFIEAEKIFTEELPWVIVCNDRNLRVVAPNVQNLIQSQTWYVDLTAVTVE